MMMTACLLWGGALCGAVWCLVIRKQERLRYLMYSTLFLLGQLLAAGISCQRANWLLSRAADYRSVAQLLILAALFAVAGGRKSFPDWSTLEWNDCEEQRRATQTCWKLQRLKRVLTWKNVSFCGVFLLFSLFGLCRRVEAINYSVRLDHLKRLTPEAWGVLLLSLLLVASIVIAHVGYAWRNGRLLAYSRLWGAIGLFLVMGTWAAGPQSHVHLHHYAWGGLFALTCRFAPWWSRLAQAAALGIMTDGVVSWGMERLWY